MDERAPFFVDIWSVSWVYRHCSNGAESDMVVGLLYTGFRGHSNLFGDIDDAESVP